MQNVTMIRSLDDLSYVCQQVPRILTLFSGGLDSTFLLKELARSAGTEIFCLTIDLGCGVNRSDLEELAHRFGARSIVVDGRATFARDAVLSAIRANARYMGMYPISSSLSRPIIARYAVEFAMKLGCGAIVHTANQSQNSLRRLNGSIEQLGFSGYYGTPYEFSALTREEKIAGLKAVGLSSFQARGVSGDANLWCREFESGSLDNPEAFCVPDGLFDWTAESLSRRFSSDFAIRFERGVPVAIDGIDMPLVELIEATNLKVGSFQIGRYAGLEHLEKGEKVLEVREAPAAFILMDAYRHLETAVLNAEVLREKISLEQLWVREAIEGRWYDELRTAAESFIASAASRISGTVEYRLRQGAADVCSIQAKNARYLTDRDTWEKAVAAIRGARRLSDMPVVTDTKTEMVAA
ncbi:argininosuccinate synthase-related protein [Dyella psychrodurans]|uniref:argininosuccinate synthase n=1 Tax=Dyella psychrodurans TaxID=1927960 RepID=A0A370X2Q5_9GAMM|nr:argininosuccinate synthase-related protein [Dyella psychrodurans]RDS82495.1 argininosuccinate synthase [Dyella psychrodurans]